jgi:hypothetical protein
MARRQDPDTTREPLTLVLSPEQEEALVQRVVERLQEDRDDGYLNATDASAYLGLTPAALYARVGREQVPYRRVGKHLFFRRAQLRAYVEDTPLTGYQNEMKVSTETQMGGHR